MIVDGTPPFAPPPTEEKKVTIKEIKQGENIEWKTDRQTDRQTDERQMKDIDRESDQQTNKQNNKTAKKCINMPGNIWNN